MPRDPIDFQRLEAGEQPQNREKPLLIQRARRQLQFRNHLSKRSETRLERSITKFEERNACEGEGLEVGERGEVGLGPEEFFYADGTLRSPRVLRNELEGSDVGRKMERVGTGKRH